MMGLALAQITAPNKAEAANVSESRLLLAVLSSSSCTRRAALAYLFCSRLCRYAPGEPLSWGLGAPPLPPPDGGWNRSRYVRRQPDRSRHPSRPPPPPPDYGNEHCSVPLWEREFCSYVGSISWQRFCENKQYVSVYNNLEQWDDSGAFENFQNAKARFWSNYHGQPSDIPLPGPDMYTDKVDHHCKVDPELVADLDKVRLPFDSDYSALAIGSGNAGADKKCTQNGSGNWDIYIEKPSEVNKWDWEASLGSKAIWGGNNESSWGNSNSGWGAALEKPSWRGWSNNQYAPNNRNNNLYGGSNCNRYWEEDPSQTYGRKRNRGRYFQQRNNNRGTRMRGTKEAAGGIIEEGMMNGVPCITRACQYGQGMGGGS